MHCKKIYRIFSMRRGGQHVLIDWLLEQSDGDTVFLNDLDPFQDITHRLAVTGEFDRFYKDGKPAYVKRSEYDVLIVNHEDWPVDVSTLSKESLVGVSADEICNILLLREPLNLFASRYFFTLRMPLNAERWRWDDVDLWMNHAEHFLLSGDEPRAASLIPVNFDRWICDRSTRKALSDKLQLNFIDQSINNISHVGSQFDSEIDEGYSTRVSSRWRYASQIESYRKIFSPEVVNVSQRIFEDSKDFEELFAINVSEPLPYESVLALFRSGETGAAQYAAMRLCHESPMLNNLGLLAGIFAQQKKYEDVIACCDKMLVIDPGNPSIRYNLALAYQELSRFDEARPVYEGLLSENPDNTGVAINLANLCIKCSELDRAHQLLEHIQSAGIATFEFYNTKALLSMEEEDYDSAIDALNIAIGLNSDAIVPYINLARCYTNDERFDEADKNLQHLVDSGYASEHSVQLAMAYNCRLSGDSIRAVSILLAERSCGVHSLDVLTELANAYNQLDEYDLALQAYNDALMIRHAYEKTFNNIGAIYLLKREYELAEQYFDRAISIKPDYAEAHWNKAFVLLLTGNLEYGWKEYEWRFDVGVASRLVYDNCVEWSGQALAGKKILLYLEQGYGDAIQFSRYCKVLSDTGAKVHLHCKEAIAGLMTSVDGVEDVITEYEGDYDYYAPLMSIPYYLNEDVVPISSPYIFPDYSEVSENITGKLSTSDGSRTRIGVVWCGNPAFKDNRRRSLGIDSFVQLAERNDVTLFSLQKGEASKELNKYNNIDNIINLDSNIDSFTDTAYIIKNLDLVITVDTSVAHLSAAMGAETWVLLSYSADWRWHENETVSRWYDTARLFRQNTPGDWDDVFAQVNDYLDRL